MELVQVVRPGRQMIERYGAEGFRVSGTLYRGPVLVFPEQTIDWPAAEISEQGLAPVFSHGDIEVLLLGLGRRMAPLAAAVRNALRAHRIGFEAMDTGAACRTYNVLIAEERRVAAALLPPV